MTWEIEYTDEFEAWWMGLTIDEQGSIDQAVDALVRQGPALGRPWADTIKTSRHSHMKELRPRRGHLRVLFAFDPRRTAILLIGGDKTGHWETWYAHMVPVADRLYDQHLTTLQHEGETP